MKEEDFIEALEIINSEKRKLQGKIYKLSKVIKRVICFIRKGMPVSALKELWSFFVANTFRGKTVDYKKVNNCETHYELWYRGDGRIAIYTCIIDEYDQLIEPLLKLDGTDFFLFTDCPEKYAGMNTVYKIRKIPDHILAMGSVFANRYLKMHPGDFFCDYDYSIYIDGNVRAVSDIRTFVLQTNNKLGIAMYLHRLRDCIYDEARICIRNKKGERTRIREQINRYRKVGFPRHFGLNEATIVVTALNNPIANKVLNLWWLEFIGSRSMRDQLSWPYVLWRNGFTIRDVGCLGSDIHKSNKVEILDHI